MDGHRVTVVMICDLVARQRDDTGDPVIQC